MSHTPVTAAPRRRVLTDVRMMLVWPVLGSVAFACLAYAQSRVDADFNRVSQNPAVIRSQLGLALAHEEQALAILKTGDPATRADADAVMRQAYYQLRFAVSGLRLKMEGRSAFANPLLGMTADQIDQAMHHVRVALQALEYADQTKAIEELEHALTRAQQAADLL
jgi:hypothetical protein